MLLIQKYLETHSFADLAKEHGVYASFSKSGHKFSLNYDMIEAKENDPLSQECRGLILALADGRPLSGLRMDNVKLNYDHIIPGETQILAFPMRRFFNNGQGSAANINWQDPNLKILEKLDGSLIILYYDKIVNTWHTATRAVPEADVFLDNNLFTFRTLFEKALQDTINLSFNEFTNSLNKNITYCFELTTPINRIVVSYQDYKITLLAARDIQSLQEIDINTIEIGVPRVHAHALNSLENVLNWVSAQNPLEHEGVVVLDSNFNRIKIKNINYILLNKTRDTICNDRAFLGLILSEKIDDVWEVLPEVFQKRTLELKDKYQQYVSELLENFAKISSQATNQKEFALLVQENNLWGAPCFALYSKKCETFKDFIAKNKNKTDSSFSNSFLDKILDIILK